MSPISELTGLSEGVGRFPVRLEKIQRLNAQITQRVDGRAWLGEQESLRQAATHVAKDLELLTGLDALGDDRDVEAARHGNDGADDGVVGRIGGDVAHETPVDLQRVDAPALQVRQARVASTEIVDGDFHTQVTQRRERILAELAAAILEQRPFGELE